MQTFSNSIFRKCMEKLENSDALLVSAVFGTRQHVDYRMVFWSTTF